jgi:glycosyltransferase 2 family protein
VDIQDSDPERRSRARAILVPLLKAGVSLALLALLFSKVDVARLWTVARTASLPWLAAALALYLGMILVSAWRWGLLLRAQAIPFSFGGLTASFLVATFFNNFLPSNIGGDVIRIADTAAAAGSKTIAATVVLIDRGLGLLGLVLVAALGASAGLGPASVGPVGPALLWAGFGVGAMLATPALLMPEGFTRILHPLRIVNPEWVDERLERLTAALSRFKESPGSLASCFAGAVAVQGLLVAFYLAIAHSLLIPISFAQLAVVVPISFIVQMLPVSMNGFGVREATFGLYFTRLGLPLESALLVSFIGAALVLLFSLSGGVVSVVRQRAPRQRRQSGPAHRSA